MGDLGVLSWSHDERLATGQAGQADKDASNTTLADILFPQTATPTVAALEDTRETLEMQLVLLDLLVRGDPDESLVRGMTRQTTRQLRPVTFHFRESVDGRSFPVAPKVSSAGLVTSLSMFG